MKFEVKSRWSDKILFSIKTESLKLAVESGVTSGADLSGADLSGADLRGADMRGADLSEAYLSGADLSGADLRGAYLSRADLSEAYLSGADLRGAYLSGADLSGADLRGAYLSRADLSGTKGLQNLPFQFQTCPRSGSFEAWKKLKGNHIAKLEIPWFARRTANIEGRKCRAELAIVKAIWDSEGKPVIEGQNGNFSIRKITYRVGGFVSSRNYDASWTKDCSNGIHFFMTLEEAEGWVL